MSDFVYDNTSLPSGKVDAPGKNLGVPANQKLTAAEYAVLTQAIEDLRTAVLSGKYHGLANNTAAAVSSALEARIRSNNGAFEVSQGGSEFRTFEPSLHVRAYGAKGDNATDDTTALQNAINAAQTAGVPLILDSGARYLISSPLLITAAIQMFSTGGVAGGGYAEIKATGTAWSPSTPTMRCVISVGHGGCKFRGIMCNANNVARYGWFLKYAVFSHFQQCAAYLCLSDGFHLPQYQGETPASGYALCDTAHFEDCHTTYTGKLFYSSGLPGPTIGVTGVSLTCQVSTTAGSHWVTFSDAAAFAELAKWLRWGDSIAIHNTGDYPTANAHYNKVEDTDANPLDLTGHRVFLTDPVPFTATNVNFVIGHGDGIHMVHFGNNNINRISRGLFHYAANNGLYLTGQAGQLVSGSQIDYCGFFGCTLGPGGAGVTYTMQLSQVYFEACVVSSICFNNCVGATLVSPEFGLGSGTYQDILTLGSYNNGIVTGSVYNIGSGYLITPFGMSAVGGAVNDVPTRIGLDFFNSGKQGSGIGGATIAANQLQYDSAVLQLPSGTVDLTGTPSITTPSIGPGLKSGGARLQLINPIGTKFTLHDETDLAGSKLRLKTATVDLLNYDSIDLIYDTNGGYWVELSRCLRQNFTDNSSSPGTSATQNSARAGKVLLSSGQSVYTITNNAISAASRVNARVGSVDTTAKTAVAVCTANTITITANANATANCILFWDLLDV